MRSRSTNLRTKVVALLVSLVALWSFAAWVTLRDGLTLLWVQTLNSKVFVPSEPLLLELQQERRVSLAYLGKPSDQQRQALAAERQKTDGLATTFKTSGQSWQADFAGSVELQRRIREAGAALDGLAATRATIDTQSIDRTAASNAFNQVVDSMFRVYDSLANLDDPQIAKDTAALIQLQRARELMSQEDALLTGVIAAGRITSAEQAQFAQLVGAQRIIAADAAGAVSPADRARYNQVAGGDARVRAVEDRVIQSGRPGAKAPVDAMEWRNAVEPALAGLHDVVAAGGVAIVQRATPIAIWVLIRLVLAAGLGLLAVIASIVVSVTTARALVAQLERLRNAANDLADQRLPGVVARLGRGEQVDVAAEAPPLDFGHDEIGQVGQAFNRVQETAVRTAVEQAKLRRSVRDVFLSLARRTQALVHRQVTLLDAMERREQDAEELDALFRIDHLATRMRRNAENLIVLSGAAPGRAWRRNVPMIDVVRAATQEVEDYQRVNVLPFGPVGLAGRAVGDVIHLLAELIENALSFSPPHTGVEIKGQIVANGYAIEVEDRGLGMSEEDLAAANVQIASRQEFNLSNSARLGLYVVSRLTERHGIRVQLKESPYGGTTAVVLIPLNLVTEAAPDGNASGAVLNGRTPAATSGARHADESRRASDGPPAQAAGAVAVAEPPEQPAWQAPVPAPTSSDLPPLQRRQPRPQEADPPTGQAGPDSRTSVPPGDWPPAAPVVQPEAAHTPSGLPFRVRQASLAPPLRDEGPAASGTADQATPRPPDQVRKVMSSYQSGTRRGRADAARLLDEDNTEHSATEPEDSPATRDDPLT